MTINKSCFGCVKDKATTVNPSNYVARHGNDGTWGFCEDCLLNLGLNPLPLTVAITAHGNPDRREHPGRFLALEATVRSLTEASAVCSWAIREHQLGGGNWTGGQVFCEGRERAYVSYNGRVWNAGGWQGDDTPIHEPNQNPPVELNIKRMVRRSRKVA